jgi:membrane-associated phospholipid phosphatase
MKRIALLIIFLFFHLFCFSQNWDVTLLRNINTHRNISLDQFFLILTNFTAALAYGIPLFLFLFAQLKENTELKMKSLFIGVSTLIALVASTLLKHIIHRKRPYLIYPFIHKIGMGGGPSFPSGHTSDAFTLAAALCIAFPKWYVIVPSLLWAVAVGYSRIYLGVHYPSDVLASMIMGICCAFLGSEIFRYKNQTFTLKRLNS